MKRGMILVSALAFLPVYGAGCEKANKGTTADDKMPANQVQLVGAGVDPKVQLRYNVAKGTKVDLDMVMTMSMEAAGRAAPSLPTMRMSMSEECTDVEAGGAMRFLITFGDFSADGGGPMAGAMDTVKDMMKDMRYRFRMSPSGKIDDVQVEGLSGPMAQMGSQLKDSIEQFAAPLPEEPVGKGSTWKFKRGGEVNGIKMSTVSQMELVSYENNVATIKVDGRVMAPSQTVDMKGMSFKLHKLDGKVGGTIANDLTRLAPSGSFGMTMDMSMEIMGRKADMKMKLDTEMTSH